MKLEKIKVWIACIVVFAVTSPQNAVALIMNAPTHIQVSIKKQVKLCMGEDQPIHYMKKAAKKYGKFRVQQLGWSKKEWKALHDLWDRESRWDFKAANPTSTAYGIPQILNLKENTSIFYQVEAGLRYIQSRYKTPTSALSFHYKNGWY